MWASKWLKHVAAVALAITLSGIAAAQGYDSAAEQQFVDLVNAERAKHGLGKLEIDERLTEIARKHSALMSQRHQLSHQFAGEPDVRARVAATGMRFNYSGENVAYDSRGVDAAHEGLMNSPPHRENILRPQFNAIGVGVIRSGDILFVTEDFAHKLPEVSLNQAEQVIAASFARLRTQSGAKPLPRIDQPGLRQRACDLAAHDQLSPVRVRPVKGVKNVVVWTATELEDLPPSMLKLGNVDASGYSLGACLATSKSYPNAVYWVALVTYY